MAIGIEDSALLPVLSRGRHRNPRKGACFMEYASYLAGAAWSDHPDCTHPLLALVAREVNDETSDAARVHLVPMIPSVIGVVPDDPRVAPALVARCVPLVLPVVSWRFQPTLAAALLTAEHVLSGAESYEEDAPLVLAGTIRAVSDFRVPEGDALLRRLLGEAIEECRAWMSPPVEPTAADPTVATVSC